MIQFEIVKDEFRKNKDVDILLPIRATEGSAGYDFYLLEDIVLLPEEKKLIWTDIKVQMPKDLVFEIIMRSSYGIKKDIMLKNIIGKIDSDYYGNENNDGNIGICLYNYGKETQILKKYETFCQGTFFKYYIVDNDSPANIERIGGIGSTSK